MIDPIDPDWAGVRAGARMLRVSTGAFYRIVAAAGVRTRTLPGCATRYSVADLARIDAEAEGIASPRASRQTQGAA
jgi:hypothetical protein